MNVESMLKLKHLVFDEISFKRHGFKNKEPFSPNIEIRIGETLGEEKLYVVTLILSGEKKNEYSLKIQLSGFFLINNCNDDRLKNILIQRNAVAILMPYLRSQVTMLTSQPEIDPVILSVFDITKLVV